MRLIRYLNNVDGVINMRYKFLVMFLLVIGLFSFASAAPPAQTSVNIQVGLQIFYPQYEYIKINEPFALHIHISNVSNGVEVGSLLDYCNLHLYNSTGSHILQENLTLDSNGIDWKLDILGGNFSQLGEHSFRIYCEDTLGGEVGGTFMVTNSGVEPPEDSLIFMIGLIFFICILSFYFQYLSHEMNEVGFKIFFFLLSLIFILTDMIISYMIISYINLQIGISTGILALVITIGSIVIIMFIYFLIRTTINALDLYNIKRGREWSVGGGSKVGGFNTKRAY